MATSEIKKGINIWSFPEDFSVKKSIEYAAQTGFEGIELALSKRGEVSLNSTVTELEEIRAFAEKKNIKINSLATGLYWEYSLTSNKKEIRDKAEEIVIQQLKTAKILGVENILVCPGTVGVDFKPEEVVPDSENIEFYAGNEVIDYDVAYERSLTALLKLSSYAQQLEVSINVENIWNRFLLSPLEFRDFIDEIGSSYVGVHFDVGNIVAFGYPEQWIRILGSRIKMVHFKDYRRSSGNLGGFVDLLAGDVNWPAVMQSFKDIGYTGWANAEMCPVYKTHSEQIVRNTTLAMDTILGRSNR